MFSHQFDPSLFAIEMLLDSSFVEKMYSFDDVVVLRLRTRNTRKMWKGIDPAVENDASCAF